MTSRDKPFDVQIKLLLVGDSFVGKTQLLIRYVNGYFTSTFITSVGIDFKIKNVVIGGIRCKLQIWDTQGQERFRTITTSYYRGAHGIMIMYSITDRQSFLNVARWYEQIRMHADERVDIILVGNNCNMEAERVVAREEGEMMAAQLNIPFIEVSANLGEKVGQIFTICK